MNGGNGGGELQSGMYASILKPKCQKCDRRVQEYEGGLEASSKV